MKRQSFSQYIKQIQSSLGEIEQHRKRTEETEGAIEAAETDFLQRLQATEKKLSDFDSQFETQKTRVDTLITVATDCIYDKAGNASD